MCVREKVNVCVWERENECVGVWKRRERYRGAHPNVNCRQLTRVSEWVSEYSSFFAGKSPRLAIHPLMQDILRNFFPASNHYFRTDKFVVSKIFRLKSGNFGTFAGSGFKNVQVSSFQGLVLERLFFWSSFLWVTFFKVNSNLALVKGNNF